MTVTSSNDVHTIRPTSPLPAPSGRPRMDTRSQVRSGHFALDLRANTWRWTPQLATLLGEPATAAAGVDLLLAHVDPTEHTALLTELAGCTQGVPFAAVHRIVRADGSELLGTVVGEPEADDAGEVTTISGLVVAPTAAAAGGADEARVRALEAEVEQMRTAMASRAQIEQAKGVLMLLTGFTEQACFDLLGHISSHTHRKVRDLAGEITASAAGRSPLPEDIRAILRDACPPAPSAG